MTGFEPRTSGIVSNCSTNWATTTAQEYIFVEKFLTCVDGALEVHLDQWDQIKIAKCL